MKTFRVCKNNEGCEVGVIVRRQKGKQDNAESKRYSLLNKTDFWYFTDQEVQEIKEQVSPNFTELSDLALCALWHSLNTSTIEFAEGTQEYDFSPETLKTLIDLKYSIWKQVNTLCNDRGINTITLTK